MMNLIPILTGKKGDTPSQELNSTRNRVIFVAGQSNAVGSAPDCRLATLPTNLSYLSGDNKWAKIRKIDDTWEDLNLGINTAEPRSDSLSLDNFGMEVQFSKLLNDTFDDGYTNYVIKWAWGGQPIEVFMEGGAYYNQISTMFIDALASISANNNDYSCVFYWDQGEKDAADGSLNLYEAQLTELINHYRSILNVRSLPFFIRKHIRDTSWPNISTLIQIQENVVASVNDSYLINAQDLRLGDIYHLSAYSQCELAYRTFDIAKYLFD